MIYQDWFYRHLKLWMCFFRSSIFTCIFWFSTKYWIGLDRFLPSDYNKLLKGGWWRRLNNHTLFLSCSILDTNVLTDWCQLCPTTSHMIFCIPRYINPKNKTKLGFWIPQELSLTFFPLMCYKSTMDHGDLRSRDEGCCSLLGTHRSPLKFVPWITSGFKVRGSFWSIFWTDGWPAKLAGQVGLAYFFVCQKCLNITHRIHVWYIC